jgi:hypothetical protein
LALSFRAGFDYLIYALNDYYIDQPDGPVDSAERGGSSLQYGIGLTLGTTETRRVWGVPVPRVGVGYRSVRTSSYFASC